jgi:hypothetical protein
MPIGWELAAANLGERVVAEMLERIPVAGRVVIAEKGFAGAEFEDLMDRAGARPDRKNEPRRHGSSGGVGEQQHRWDAGSTAPNHPITGFDHGRPFEVAHRWGCGRKAAPDAPFRPHPPLRAMIVRRGAG